MRRRAESNRYRAKSDSGNDYVIIEYQDFIPAGTHDDPNAELPGLKSLITSTGLHVNYVDDQTFQIVSTGEILRKA